MKLKIKWILCSAMLLAGIGTITLFILPMKQTAVFTNASHFTVQHKEWNIYFESPMDPGTFTTDTVQIISSGKQIDLGDMSWNHDYTMLTIHPPKHGYDLHKTYQITVNQNVQTAKGKSLSKAITHTFTAVEHVQQIKDKNQLHAILTERMKEEKNENHEDMAFKMEDDVAMEMNDMDSGNSETNVQVTGIDEADIIKTNGKQIFFMRENDIIITSAAAENSKVLSTIQEEGFRPHEMYVHEDTLIVLGYTNEPIRKNHHEDHADTSDKIDAGYHETSEIRVYDITKPSHPEKIREISLEGSLAGTRKTEHHLYVLANYYPEIHVMDKQDIRPYIRDSAAARRSIPISYDDLYFFPESNDDQFMILAAIDLNDWNKGAHITSYLGSSDDFYMSPEHLYIAVENYNEEDSTLYLAPKKENDTSWEPSEPQTEILKFRLDGTSIQHTATANVPGRIINQFAMDERNDTFRIATTSGHNWQANNNTVNNLYVFDDTLQQIGAVEGLAIGEEIYSVRFMEDVAYMVTFETVDPLFVIDLSTPRDPKVLGELKIPGFSNYLHPLDENHVIGFGQQTTLVPNNWSDRPSVQLDGIKVSLFDVSDPTSPIEKDYKVIGRGSSYTELNDNHHALYKHPSKPLFGMPATIYRTKNVSHGRESYEEDVFSFEGGFLLEITPENGIEVIDSITHQEDKQMDYPNSDAELRRMLSLQNILYSFSNNHMKVYHLDSNTIIHTVNLPSRSF